MIASSTTVLANLAYLIGAVLLAVIIGLLIWLRHRQPKSVDANMASFRRGLSALAPEAYGSAAPLRPTGGETIRPSAVELTHVRVEPVRVEPVRVPSEGAPSEEGGDDPEGGQPG